MKKIKINFVDFWHGRSAGEIKQNPLFVLLSKKFDLEVCKNPDYLIYSSEKFGKSFLYYRCVRIFYTGENERPNYNECDYSFSFDYNVSEKNYRLPLYKFYCDLNSLIQKKPVDDIAAIKDKFCSFLVSNEEGPERIEFYHMLSNYKRVDSGGRVLNNLGYRVKNRGELLRNYKFSISFENSSFPGYTTEKIVMPFVYNTIPIYWGNPLVDKDFNPESFINCHDFKNFSQVVEHVKRVDSDANLYKKYLSQPIFHENKVPYYLTDEAILDRFDEIFANKIDPVGGGFVNNIKLSAYVLKKQVKKIIRI